MLSRQLLNDTGVQALRACLPGDLYDLAVATSIRPATRMIFMDERLRPKFAKDIPDSTGLGVNRLTLREILMRGLDVRFGMTYERYEPLPQGVRAHFADGRSVDGDLLVGAEGVGSRVRAQLRPGAVVDRLGWSLYGRTWLRDARLLSDLLADGRPTAKVSYERQMLDYAFAAVRASREHPFAPVSALGRGR